MSGEPENAGGVGEPNAVVSWFTQFCEFDLLQELDDCRFCD